MNESVDDALGLIGVCEHFASGSMHQQHTSGQTVLQEEREREEEEKRKKGRKEGRKGKVKKKVARERVSKKTEEKENEVKEREEGKEKGKSEARVVQGQECDKEKVDRDVIDSVTAPKTQIPRQEVDVRQK